LVTGSIAAHTDDDSESLERIWELRMVTPKISVTVGNVKKNRPYQMESRADAVEKTREGIMRAAYELWLKEDYDDVSLERVADRAGVSKQTVIRQFGSKDRLAYATVDWQRPREEAARAVEPGDVPGAIEIVVDRYERMGDANVRVLELEHRVPAIRYLLEQGRESHRAWVERVFAPFLPKQRGAARRRRVMAFYAATEVMTWKLVRRDFRMSRKETRAVLLALVSGLVQDREKEE
jgi:AcrR family transcriptional regulator